LIGVAENQNLQGALSMKRLFRIAKVSATVQ